MSINHILAILINNLNNPSLVRLILVSHEFITFLMQIQFQVILDILLLELVSLLKVFVTLTISYHLLQLWIYLSCCAC